MTIAVAMLSAPLASWQYGSAGGAAVALLAVAVILAVVISTWAEQLLTRLGRALAGILAAMGIRMVFPLAVALVMVVWGRSLVPAGAVLYVVPLYLAMLAAETRSAVRRLAVGERDGSHTNGNADSVIGKRG